MLQCRSLQEPALTSLKSYRAQSATGERAGIYPDSVSLQVDVLGNTMSVDHDLLKCPFKGQKFITNPPEVMGLLFRKRNLRPQSCVYEHIVANDNGLFKRFDEFDDISGYRCLKCPHQAFEIARKIFNVRHSEAENCLTPTNSNEKLQRRKITGHDAKKNFFVIAKQKSRRSLRPIRRQLLQAGNDAGRIGSAIDQIPKKDERGLCGTAPRIIRFDLGKQIVEQIESAMYVADGVDTLTWRHARIRSP